jgi:hypothetical protein
MAGKVERIESARMDRMERVAYERHERLLDALVSVTERLGKVESVTALILSHVSADNATYVRMQKTIDDLTRRVQELESGQHS